MKRVIFVGGTAYSGSTLLDMVLANTPAGFSCGEVSRLFHPYRPHHFNYVCGCDDTRCVLWQRLRQAGARELYQKIFEIHPEVSYIVDSSKDPLWINERTIELNSLGIGVENVVTWKTPIEYFSSCAKRGQQRGWETAWINYHTLYFRMVHTWFSVRHLDLVSSEDTLRRLCECLGVPYLDGQHRYWEKVHHTLFGNHSAKLHLYEKGSPAYQRSVRTQKQNFHYGADRERSGELHQAILRQAPPSAEPVDFQPLRSEMTDAIVSLLGSRSVTSPNTSAAGERIRPEAINALKASKVYELRRRAQRHLSTRGMKLYMRLNRIRSSASA